MGSPSQVKVKKQGVLLRDQYTPGLFQKPQTVPYGGMKVNMVQGKAV